MNKNSASRIYRCMLQYFYLILLLIPWYFFIWFSEQLFPWKTSSVCCWYLANSYQSGKQLKCNTWIAFMYRLVNTCPQVQLFAVGFASLCSFWASIYLMHAIFFNLQGISLDKNRKLFSNCFVTQLLWNTNELLCHAIFSLYETIMTIINQLLLVLFADLHENSAIYFL